MDTRCNLEDLPRAIDDKNECCVCERERERVRELSAVSATLYYCVLFVVMKRAKCCAFWCVGDINSKSTFSYVREDLLLCRYAPEQKRSRKIAYMLLVTSVLVH